MLGCKLLLFVFINSSQELEALAAKLEEEKRQIEASSKNLREEKNTAAQ